jgi:hypothetical protein
LNRFVQTARPCCFVIVSGCIAGIQRQADRQTGRHTDSKSTHDRTSSTPTSTRRRPNIDQTWTPASRTLASCTRKRSKKREQLAISMMALYFFALGPTWGRLLGPLDFDVGPNTRLRRFPSELARHLEVSKSIFAHSQVNIKSKTTFGRC